MIIKKNADFNIDLTKNILVLLTSLNLIFNENNKFICMVVVLLNYFAVNLAILYNL
jgi:hypothetical protein